MTMIENSLQQRQFGLRREALNPFALALFLVIAGNIFVALTLIAARGTLPAGASANVAVETASTAGTMCMAPSDEPTTVGRSFRDDDDQPAPFTFGFLIFDPVIEGGSTSAFGPLPSCTSSHE